MCEWHEKSTLLQAHARPLFGLANALGGLTEMVIIWFAHVCTLACTVNTSNSTIQLYPTSVQAICSRDVLGECTAL